MRIPPSLFDVLTGLSDALRGETRSYENGVLVASSRESFDAATTNAVVVSWAADGGVSTNVLRFGRTLETVSPEGRTLVFHDSYGYPYLTQRSSPTGTSLDYATYAYRNLLGDLLEDGEYTLKTGSSTSSHWKYRHQGYDARGNPAASTNELGETVLRSYDARRNLVGELGDTYPVRYGCDSAGRRIRMETTRDGGTTWDETRWTYDPATGNLLSKIFADGSVETHTYTADGLPLRTTFPGGRWVENRYDGNRRLAGVSSDDPSCEAEYAYDAFGRTVASSNAIASASYGLVASGVATNEVQRVGTLQCALVRTVDPYGRVSSIRVDGGGRTDIAYAEDGRIASLSNADCRVVYRYGADCGDLGYDLILPDGTTFSRTLTRDRYQRGEVTSVTNASPVGAQGVSYAYDLCGRPVSRSGDAFAYNRRGEVASATVSGQASSYVYDTIGNETRWEANALNQMVWNDYSANGELLSYSRGSTYDSLSRLVTVGCIDRSRPGDYYDYTEYAVTNRYDAIGRRVRKETPWETRTFFYDGWMPIVEIYQKEDGTTDCIEYVWGRDLSGTIGGAGGVGGLLYLKRNGTIYIPFYDAYGNVTGYWDETGVVVASYTYDAFGETLSALGPLADAFNIRYSTKYYDAESDLYYYGYRYYAPSLHRWLTRDPIAEEGGLNLYGFCENRSTFEIDARGEMAYVLELSREPGEKKFVDITQREEIARYRLKLDVFLTSLQKDSLKFNMLVRKGCVFFNGKPFTGNYEEYRSLAQRERRSKVVMSYCGYKQSMAMIKEMIVACDRDYDAVALCAHGSLSWRSDKHHLANFAGEMVAGRDVRSALEKLTRQFGRTVTFVSCLQTHSEKNKNANTDESYALDYVIKGVEGKSYTLTPIRIVRKIDGKAVQ